jgi:hypothetical protein
VSDSCVMDQKNQTGSAYSVASGSCVTVQEKSDRVNIQRGVGFLWTVGCSTNWIYAKQLSASTEGSCLRDLFKIQSCGISKH